MIQLLYADQPLIGVEEIDKIVQCIALYADVVWLQDGVQVNESMTDEEQKHVSRTLSEYANAGFIKAWDYPIERPKSQSSVWIPKDSQLILPFEKYVKMRERVDRETELYSTKTEELIAGAGARNEMILDGFAELVHLRNNLWTSLLTAELEVSSVLANRSRVDRFRREIEHVSGYRKRDINQDFFKLFSDWQSLSGFSGIKVKEMQDIRKCFSEFRDFVLKHVQPGTELLARSEDLKSDFDALRADYQKDLEEYLRSKIHTDQGLVRRQLLAAPMTIASFFVGALGVVSHLKEVWDTRQDRLSIPPHIIYVMELQRHLG